MNKIVSALVVSLIFVVIVMVYFSMSGSMNTTGMSAIMINSIQQYVPLLLLVSFLIFLIGTMIYNNKKG